VRRDSLQVFEPHSQLTKRSIMSEIVASVRGMASIGTNNVFAPAPRHILT
jgi:hypothetical protein